MHCVTLLFCVTSCLIGCAPLLLWLSDSGFVAGDSPVESMQSMNRIPHKQSEQQQQQRATPDTRQQQASQNVYVRTDASRPPSPQQQQHQSAYTRPDSRPQQQQNAYVQPDSRQQQQQNAYVHLGNDGVVKRPLQQQGYQNAYVRQESTQRAQQPSRGMNGKCEHCRPLNIGH